MFQVNFKNKDFRSFYLQLIDTRHFLWYNTESDTGVSPSGKARDFDSLIRKFKSCYPCQQNRPVLAAGLFCCLWYLRFDLTRKARVSSHTPTEVQKARFLDAGRGYLRHRRIPCYPTLCGRSVLLFVVSAI